MPDFFFFVAHPLARFFGPRSTYVPVTQVAEDVWQAVAEEKEEVVLADLKTNVAVLLRALAPRALFGIMAKRALKAKVAGAK